MNTRGWGRGKGQKIIQEAIFMLEYLIQVGPYIYSQTISQGLIINYVTLFSQILFLFFWLHQLHEFSFLKPYKVSVFDSPNNHFYVKHDVIYEHPLYTVQKFFLFFLILFIFLIPLFTFLIPLYYLFFFTPLYFYFSHHFFFVVFLTFSVVVHFVA